MQAPWWWSKTETCRSDICVYFNVNFNVFFKLIKVHLLVSELYIYQNARCNDKNSSVSFPPVSSNSNWSFCTDMLLCLSIDIFLYSLNEHNTLNTTRSFIFCKVFRPSSSRGTSRCRSWNVGIQQWSRLRNNFAEICD